MKNIEIWFLSDDWDLYDRIGGQVDEVNGTTTLNTIDAYFGGIGNAHRKILFFGNRVDGKPDGSDNEPDHPYYPFVMETGVLTITGFVYLVDEGPAVEKRTDEIEHGNHDKLYSLK